MQRGQEGDATARRVTLRALLISPAFLVAVAVLVVNDWVLKPALGNWLTGKLSDFAGVFALPLLWSACFPSHRKVGFALTGLGFAVWKTPLIDAPLTVWNSLGFWGLTRVVDYTDWIALVALPPSYRLAERCAAASLRVTPSPGRRIAALASGLAAFLALAADTVLPPRYPLPDTTAYTVQASRDDIWNGLRALGFTASDVTTNRARAGVADTLRFYIRQPPERRVDITVEVKEVLPAVRIKLLTATAFGPAPSTPSIERAFEKQVVEPLREWLAKRPHGEH